MNSAFVILIAIAIILFIIAIVGYIQTTGNIIRVGALSNSTPPWVWATTILAVIILIAAIITYY
jgi:uncharacterized membrane protein